MDLIFRDVNVSIGSVDILKNVSGMAKQGDMLAVMGPSGAGKSTLLNSVSGRMTVKSGEITLNGSPLTRKMRRKICYVLQQDLFFANLTLKETLTFTAMLRLPEKMPHKMKLHRVEDIIDLLDLRKCMNTVMGGVMLPGLSGGERKRASIACELLLNPALIMLDEPTSGLDSAIAFHLMRTMKQYTEDASKTVIATIHQPSSQIFHMFDNVLLLAEGEVAYFGKGSEILQFFNRLEMPCMTNYNPADFILEKVKEGPDVLKKIITAAYAERTTNTWPKELRSVEKTQGNNENLNHSLTLDLAEVKIISAEVNMDEDMTSNGTCRLLGSQEEDIDNHVVPACEKGINVVGYTIKDPEVVINKTSAPLFATESHNVDKYYVDGLKWQTGFLTQFKTLMRRNFCQAKSRILSKLNIVQTLVMAVFCGIIWFQTPSSEETIQDRNGLFFYAVVYFGFVPLFDAITSFPEERGVINKERARGAYRLSAYYFAKILSECPLTFTLPFAFLTIIYWMSGFVVHAGAFMAQLGLFLYHAFVSNGIGFLIGVTFMDFKLSITVGACFMMASFLAGGYYQTNFPFWMEWVKYLSYLQYTYQVALQIEYGYTQTISCKPQEQTMFEDCALNITTQVPGSEYLKVSGTTFPIWGSILVLLLFLIVFRLSAYLVLRYYRRPGIKTKK